MGPFPVTEGGNHYVWVAMDYFTEWREAYAIPSQEAAVMAECLRTSRVHLQTRRRIVWLHVDRLAPYRDLSPPQTSHHSLVTMIHQR
ncbi:hypothetical protein SKAU_G00022080 [Synaphobranchus kaupii]|uniref:Integrase catalytic domain-containing protein n=1 Tax=Synaphobranchus kaupii TaxID=118154 RepID=A0A9Q1GDA7_SYNKA|nr:hypothetical protein SKAU_G00022080 [Synaphobranchus kaupii]